MVASSNTAALAEPPANPQSPFSEIKKEYGLFSGPEVRQAIAALPAASWIVESLIPHCSVNILVGDSGVGKTALGYQLALAVASGTPFLGFAARKNKVLLVDYENAIWDFDWILEQQRKFLGLPEYPSTFLLWPFVPSHREGVVEKAILRLRPQLVILDSLRSYCPEMERDNVLAGRQLRKLRRVTRSCGAAILLMHHVHKRRGRNGDLEEGNALDWLLRAAGSRALINQTDVRDRKSVV